MITYDQFNQIRAELRALGVATTDKRADRRIGLRYPIMVFPVVNGHCVTPRRVCLKDISNSGMGFISREPFQVGEQFVVKLANQRDGQDTLRSILCVVTACVGLKNGIYSVGAVFG